ncbi:C45 family autoproteolytic acyltransferase/hydolase [Schlesneria sp. T3-172]|uniref:C45 family autoproteolytic acyltransferase/hydolase n=1 Tax=Schlesneria sphaerica TaxID=3373610 RepID=UPI0037CAFAC2
MVLPNRYLEMEVAGTPREMGRQLGEAAGELIRGFSAIAMDRVNLTLAISREAALGVARESIPFVERYSVDMLEEMKGVAEAARISLDELMLLQVRNQLQASDSGCTSLSLGRPFCEQRILAQNWDADPALDEFTIVLTRRPVGKPAFMSVTQAGLIAYIGFNSAGVGLCANTLPAPSRRLGVPHYFLIRGVYESTSLEEAVNAVSRAERAIPANMMLTTPQGPADLEVTLESVQVLDGGASGLVTHTNHCRHPDLIRINDSFPELIQSHARQTRIDALLNFGNRNAEPGSQDATVSRLMTALSDHEGHPRSICRHTNDDLPHGFWQTVFSVIIEPDKQQMQITRGTPCDHPYERYILA